MSGVLKVQEWSAVAWGQLNPHSFSLSGSCTYPTSSLRHRAPSGWQENVLVLFTPAPQHHLASMRLILLQGGVTEQPHIIMQVEVKELSTLSSGLGDNELIEAVMMGKDQILLDEHGLLAPRQHT